MSLCWPCHHIRHEGIGVIVTFIVGPPGSGKTTWVKQHMSPGDLVVDMDYLYSALSFLEFRNNPDSLLPFVAEARDAVLNRLTRPSAIRKAWIVSSSPRIELRHQMKSKHNAEIVVLDVPEDECIRRLNDGSRSEANVALMTEKVKEWWKVYTPGHSF